MITFDGTDIRFAPPAGTGGAIVKEELGGRWDKDAREFALAPTSLNMLRLVELYGEDIINGAPDEVRDLASEEWGFIGFTDDEQTQASQHPSWDTLYDFQREGVEYLFCNPHGSSLVTLSWGLGKGAVSTVAADLLDAKRVLILAPLTLAPAWRGELERWSDRDRDIKRSTADDRAPGPEVTIANHEVIQEIILRDEDRNVIQPEWVTNARRVKQWINEGPTKVDARTRKTVPVRERIVRVRRDYLDIEWDLIIVDESVMLKNRRAVKTNVLAQLRKHGDPFMFLLSGSPVTKFNDDLFRQMQIMFPRGFTSYWRFAEFFTVVDRDGYGWTIEGNRPDRQPRHYLRDMMWVKSQDEAMVDIPEYVPMHLTLEATPQQRKALEQMLNDWCVELDEAPDERVEASNWLSHMTRLQQITSNLGSLPKPSGNGFFKPSSAKTDALMQLIADDEIETPLLVWTWYVETTNEVHTRLHKEFPNLRVASVVGADSRDEKDERLAAFKAGDLDVLVLQMATGKFGHTFTNTKTVFYHDRAFDSDAYIQSLHRVRRLGLKHNPVLIVPKINRSADELIELNLEGKIGSIARLTNANLKRLLSSLREM